jgi:hypothetical protein
MLESELFWNAPIMFEKVQMRNQREFPNTVLKRIATTKPLGLLVGNMDCYSFN